MDAKKTVANSGHGFGFKSAPPLSSVTKPVRGNNNGGSSSDMDIASDSDEEIFERQHSPQDYRIHVGLPHVAAQNGLGRNGAKVFGAADELSDSATSTEVSYVFTFIPASVSFSFTASKRLWYFVYMF